MKYFLLFVTVASLQAHAQGVSNAVHIIPQPVSVQTADGNFVLTKATLIIAKNAEDKRTAVYLSDYLQQVYGWQLPIKAEGTVNAIRIVTKQPLKAANKDPYNLSVTKEGVLISGETSTGTFYGVQTFLQLLPTEKSQSTKFLIPLITVYDYPRFSYRGMHLDVCRHFFPTSFVKKYIDYLAFHKFNYFHWHLTDDQGWLIEIKKYPELTAKAAYRNGTIIGRYPGTGNDNLRYGGYDTQAEIKDVVAYAASRHITIVPEIEMPGHSSAAIAAYPWLSCFPFEETVIPYHPSIESSQSNMPPYLGEGYSIKKVQETWGVFEDIFCAGKDSTFMFMQDVLDEVTSLFPSKYIHVGGDEAPKTHWKRCPLCQARIKAEGLKDEHGLQSYFVQRIEKYLATKGKTIIGWDEILEGGLAPNALVMSWRGEKGGIEAAHQKHQVIMTPENPVYFDHSQTKNEDSLVIGGYNPLEAVYNYEPVPKEIAADEEGFVLGAQANLWTEYITNTSKVEYMIFPRMSALSELLWSPKTVRNWKSFEERLPTQFKRYELWKANYSKAYYDLHATISPTENNEGIYWTITSKKSGRLSVADAAKQVKPEANTDTSIKVKITQSGFYHAQQNGSDFSTTINHNFFINKATGKSISITATPQPKYPGQGAFSLVNGIYSTKGLSFPDWLGFIGDDLEATIDLGAQTAIDSVRMHTLEQTGSWVYLPQYVEVLLSDDGKTYHSFGRSSTFVNDQLTMGWITVQAQPTAARYIKIVAKNAGTIPEGKPGAGNKAWLFADEIQIY